MNSKISVQTSEFAQLDSWKGESKTTFDATHRLLADDVNMARTPENFVKKPIL